MDDDFDGEDDESLKCCIRKASFNDVAPILLSLFPLPLPLMLKRLFQVSIMEPPRGDMAPIPVTTTR